MDKEMNMTAKQAKEVADQVRAVAHALQNNGVAAKDAFRVNFSTVASIYLEHANIKGEEMARDPRFCAGVMAGLTLFIDTFNLPAFLEVVKGRDVNIIMSIAALEGEARMTPEMRAHCKDLAAKVEALDA